MLSFFDRFDRDLRRYLLDIDAVNRLSPDERYDILHRVQDEVWERLLNYSSTESTIGLLEAEYTLSPDTFFYPLPGSFRQFRSFEKRLDGDRNQVVGRLPTLGHDDRGQGVEIISQDQGFVLRNYNPTTPETWTLVFQKGPVLLHHAKAKAVSDIGLTLGDPIAGVRVDRDDYLNSAIIEVYHARTGSPQRREVFDHDGNSGTVVFRNPWAPKPTGDVYYQVAPVLPFPMDQLYAMDAAADVAGPRQNPIMVAHLRGLRKETWMAACNKFLSTTADRATRRTRRGRKLLPDSGGEGPGDYVRWR